MQTKALLLVSGILDCPQIMMQRSLRLEKETTMSKTASIGLAPSATLFGRLMVTIDRLLMTSARVAVRNGDLPYFGL
jgi:hypothetical protein